MSNTFRFGFFNRYLEIDFCRAIGLYYCISRVDVIFHVKLSWINQCIFVRDLFALESQN